PAQLRQILLNLALNARDALRPGGKIHVETRAAEFPANAEDRTPRPAVSLLVEDNGCGMGPETRAHLFEPFFTTKCPGEGTGMGLATVHRIVTEAGGQIKVSTEPAHGTRVEIFFPMYETSLEPVPSAADLVSQSMPQSCAREFSSFPGSRPSGDPVPVDPRILQSPGDPITRLPNSGDKPC
ncbi:MAG: ATP-binding protein, partial [Terriglobales bacterium]